MNINFKSCEIQVLPKTIDILTMSKKWAGCLLTASRILQFQVNLHLDVFQDHFVQSLHILRSDCALEWSNISYFFYQRQVKVCARVAKYQLPLVTVFSFLWCLVYACYINVTFEFVLWYKAVHQSTHSDFTMIFRCVTGFEFCFCCVDQKKC